MKKRRKKKAQRIVSIGMAISLMLAPGMEVPATDVNICPNAEKYTQISMKTPVIVDIVESVDKERYRESLVETVDNCELKKMNAGTGIEKKTPEEKRLSEALKPEDYELLLRLVMAEAEGEPLEGKAMVARVVLNRMLSQGFPETVPDVIYQTDQFAPVADGRLAEAVPDESCLLALEIVLEGWDKSQGALYFEAVSNGTDTWHSRNLEYIKTVGNHNFYK